MNKTKIIGLSILVITIFSNNCFATSHEPNIHEINKTIALEEVEQYRKNIQNEIVIDNIKYELQDVSEHENKNIKTQDKEQRKQKIVYTNNKYDVLNKFKDEIDIDIKENKMTGTLKLQKDLLNLKVKDTYTEQYKVKVIKNYKNITKNELNNIPKTIKKNGTIYYLTNPIWIVSQVEKIEGQSIPIAYNGKMEYEGIKERKKAKSYLATVVYKGKLEKEEIESITFKIKYKQIPQEPVKEKNYIPMVATAGTGIIVISGIILWKRKKNNKI